MVWPRVSQQRNNPLLPVLKYSSLFSYPLTEKEIWFWQIRTQLSQVSICHQLKNFSKFQDFYFLPSQKAYVKKRLSHQKFSLSKWKISQALVSKLKVLFTIQAIFVTGALAMNNSPKNDDIDLMIVTSPNTLWMTRFVVAIYLKIIGVRRNPHLPEHSSPRVKDKICDNLWLDTNHLNTLTQNLYQAHEVLQAKCIYDRGGIHHQFLIQNPWVEEYLPIAYRESLNKLSPQIRHTSNFQKIYFPLLSIINFQLFILQFLYMFPHKHREQIGIGFAFFHPRQSQGYDII